MLCSCTLLEQSTGGEFHPTKRWLGSFVKEYFMDVITEQSPKQKVEEEYLCMICSDKKNTTKKWEAVGGLKGTLRVTSTE